MKAVMWLCPNANGWHEDGPLVYYLLVIGAEVVEDKKEVKDKGQRYYVWTYSFKPIEDGYLWFDLPPTRLVHIIEKSDLFSEREVIERVCPWCRKRLNLEEE